MNLSVDHFFTIGKTHKVCEDYAISGIDPIPYLIIADGCSSSPNTDIGSRILAHIAKDILKTTEGNLNYHLLGSLVVRLARETIEPLGLSNLCLDSTLIIAFKFNSSWQVFVYGDGGIISVAESFSVYQKISFSNSMPYYLSYWNNPERRMMYEKENIIKTVTSINLNTRIEQEVKTKEYGHQGLYDSKLLIICSDGISSFVNTKFASALAELNIVKDLLSIKSLKGEFIKRRARRMIKTFAKSNIFNLDDLAVAGMWDNYKMEKKC